MKTIKFNTLTDFTGRNGTMRCGGVALFPGVSAGPRTRGSGVLLAPLTSKGAIGRCDITIPEEDAGRVGAALLLTQAPANAEVCTFVPASSLVPVSWRHWFWSAISTSAPFSWGDNNHTLVDGQSFADHCEDTLLDCEHTSQSAITKFLSKVRKLGNTYIDLEN